MEHKRKTKVYLGKYLLLLFSLLLFVISSCEKEKNPDAGYLPEGITRIDSDHVTDCSLPKCSRKRVARYKAKQAVGQMLVNSEGEYYVKYDFGFDTRLEFYFCDLKENFRKEGLRVVFSGNAVHACGIKTPIFGGQEMYFLRLSSIRKI